KMSRTVFITGRFYGLNLLLISRFCRFWGEKTEFGLNCLFMPREAVTSFIFDGITGFTGFLPVLK
ncbi:MAG TPA: hypothetical protein PK228_16510, partial [Saprospiraceae bacterium]|nr:hypothetical protein [Saprospiraceae bacterium]